MACGLSVLILLLSGIRSSKFLDRMFPLTNHVSCDKRSIVLLFLTLDEKSFCIRKF